MSLTKACPEAWLSWTSLGFPERKSEYFKFSPWNEGEKRDVCVAHCILQRKYDGLNILNVLLVFQIQKKILTCMRCG